MWLLDISQLVKSMNAPVATGILRVEMAYAQHFLALADSDDVRFVVTLPRRTAIFDKRQIAPLITATAARWLSQRSATQGNTLSRLNAILAAPIGEGRSNPIRINDPAAKVASLADTLDQASLWARCVANPLSQRQIAEFRAKAARFVHVSQFRLHRPQRYHWLRQAGASSLFFLHDLIPITHPEYFYPGDDLRHAQRVKTMLDHASVIVANSSFTRDALARFCKMERRQMPRCEILGLGVDSAFLEPLPAANLNAAPPYFVAIGTIEPRKNLAFLLQVWLDWIKSRATAPARLVIVGRRGWENENVLDLLERSPGLSGTVIEVNSLDDGGMAQLLRGAAALLAPSLVEGFGLPIVEAMALKVPVIASDIPAFREVGGDLVDFVSPIDGIGWARLLDEFASAGSQHRRRRVETLARFRPMDWPSHTRRAEQILLDAQAGRF